MVLVINPLLVLQYGHVHHREDHCNKDMVDLIDKLAFLLSGAAVFTFIIDEKMFDYLSNPIPYVVNTMSLVYITKLVLASSFALKG